jgi:PAS domain S-box-containing protein
MAKGAESFATGVEAARQAMAGIDEGRPLSAVLVFASVRYDLEELLRGIHSVVGQAPLLGSTTAGEICDGPQQESVVVVALASPHLRLRVGVGEGVAQDWRGALAQALSTPEIRPFFSPEEDIIWPELTRQGKSAFALLFSPGNTQQTVSRSYEILEELKRLSQGLLPIFGGSSADDWRMKTNYILWGERAYPDSLLVVVFETRLRFGTALAHGFRPSLRQATVTRAQGHEALELDGQPAAGVYARLLGMSREELEGKHLTLTTGRPAGTPDLYGQYNINVASYFTPQGGVRFAQPVAEGTILTIIEADRDSMIAAGQEALRKALMQGHVGDPALVLVFSCALRTRILEERTGEEIARMRDLVPGVPLVGFYSFGEQGLADGGVNRHNNEVITTLVLGRELSFAAQVALENERLREELEGTERHYRDLFEGAPVMYIVTRSQGETPVIADCNQAFLSTLGYSRDEVLGRPLGDFYTPESRYELLAGGGYQRALANRFGTEERQLLARDGRVIHALLHAASESDAGSRLTGTRAIYMDVTERVQAEEEIRRRSAQLEALREVGLELTAQLDLATLLHSISTRAVELVGGSGGGVYLYRPDKDGLEWTMSVGSYISSSPQGMVLRRGEGVSGKVWESGQPLIVDDHRNWEGRAAAYDDYAFTAMVAVPIRWGQEFLGVLNVVADPPHAFVPADADLLGLFATQAAIAIRNARLYEQTRQDAETRAALLREVNHRVKNNLMAIIGLLYAEQGRDEARGDPLYQTIMRELINRVQGLAAVHSLLSASEWAPLRLSDLAMEIIQAALKSLPRDKEVSVGVPTSSIRVTPDQAHSLALVFNELATNTIRHAMVQNEARAITVHIARDGDSVACEYRDDGPGFSAEALREEGRNVGLNLVHNVVRRSLHGDLVLRNDGGAVALIRFKADAR